MTHVHANANANAVATGTRLDENKCPMRMSRPASESIADSDIPRLMRVSEVAMRYPKDSPMGGVLEWVHNFLAAPHSDVGRKGSVCPFVPLSLEMDTIWMVEVSEQNPSLERISAIISEYRDLFLATEPINGPNSINKAFMVVFPNLGADGATVVDDVQYQLKMDFVEMGLMLGEFHAKNEGEGLRNPDFRPLRSPIPILAIRHMVDSDLPFLLRSEYPPNKRASFMRSYLTRLAGTLSRSKFETALNGVIEAEIEKWMSQMNESDAPATSTWFCPKCKPSDDEQVSQ
ncbi:MAG TPA: hypothetical protein VNW52_08600 [Burkholderiaceae bacterium]|jgi:hypothetical protein|nr:hypothetical protein [Burkholderiaceae bacterium]